jgi:hypothetical protein
LLHGALEDGYLRGSRIAPFDPPIFYPSQEASLAEIAAHARTGQAMDTPFLFDAELGWAPTPESTMGQMNFNWAGARRSAAPLKQERRADMTRVVCVGCSFTLGDEVTDEQAWPRRLDAAAPRHEFVNLGMGAYGLDQALLRYRRDGRPLQADEVWVGWMPAASLRLLTQYRPAQRHWAKLVRFKPRFQLGPGGSLRLIPNPVDSIAKMHAVLSSQETFLEALDMNDGWVARSPLAYAPTGSHWLHHTGLGRMALTLHEQGDRDVAAWLLDEESEISRLLLAIVNAFQEEAASDGTRLRLLVLPDRGALEDLIQRGRGYWAGITEACERAGVEVIDCSAALIKAGAAEAKDCWAPGGHYSEEGNRVVAESLRALLKP